MGGGGGVRLGALTREAPLSASQPPTPAGEAPIAHILTHRWVIMAGDRDRCQRSQCKVTKVMRSHCQHNSQSTHVTSAQFA